MYNNIKGGWEGEGNIDVNPGFEGDSYNLSDSSTCIGHGVDSIEVEGTWYFATPLDLYGNKRPHSEGDCVDLGAIESEYTGCFVGIKEHHSPDEQILIYPNPTKDLLNIELAKAGNNIIEITSLNGQLFYSD